MEEGSRVVEILMHIVMYLYISHKHQALNVWSRMPHSSSQELYLFVIQKYSKEILNPGCFFFPVPQCDKQNMKAKLYLLLKIPVSNTAEFMGSTGLTKQPTQFKHISAQHPCFLLSWENYAIGVSAAFSYQLFVVPTMTVWAFSSQFARHKLRIRTTKLWQLMWQGELFCCNMNITSELRNRPWKIELTKHFNPVFASTVT